MEFFQKNQKTILIVLAVLAVVFLVCKQGLVDCSMGGNENYQANNTCGGRGLPGRGLTANRLIPKCYKAQENHYMK